MEEVHEEEQPHIKEILEKGKKILPSYDVFYYPTYAGIRTLRTFQAILLSRQHILQWNQHHSKTTQGRFRHWGVAEKRWAMDQNR